MEGLEKTEGRNAMLSERNIMRIFYVFLYRRLIHEANTILLSLLQWKIFRSFYCLILGQRNVTNKHSMFLSYISAFCNLHHYSTKNIQLFRTILDVKTIPMGGSGQPDAQRPEATSIISS